MIDSATSTVMLRTLNPNMMGRIGKPLDLSFCANINVSLPFGNAGTRQR
jgi:hypothetical protein